MRLWAANLALAGVVLAQDTEKSLPSMRTTIGPSTLPGAPNSGMSRVLTPAGEVDQVHAADVRMGERMIEGPRTERNVARGLELLESAAEAKYVPALVYLGGLYELGTNDIAINNKRSAGYYRQCADTGILECQFGLGRVLVSDSLNRVEGIAWLELAAERGSVEARELFTQELAFTPPGQLEQARAMKRILLPR